MSHAVLLGDSVFDNAAYVAGGPDVVRQLRLVLGGDHVATLVAVDGNVISDIERQTSRIPADATHLIVSVGGNDALRDSAVLQQSARSVAEAVGRLAAVRTQFQKAYELMLDRLTQRGLPLAVCTIYEPRFPEPTQRLLAWTALTLLNDVITRSAFSRGAALVDLRLICNDDADFANPIEPSTRGGEKIARAIASFVTGTPGAAMVFTR